VRLYVDCPAAGFVSPAPPVVNDQHILQFLIFEVHSRILVFERPRDAA
jgi:hypothetical protein